MSVNTQITSQQEHAVHPRESEEERLIANDSDGANAPKELGKWDQFMDRIRLATPALIVNEGGRIDYFMRGSADVLSIKSGLRPAILNDEKMHGGFFQKYPDKIPEGFTKYEKGMRLGMSAPYRVAGSAVTLFGLGLGVFYGEKPHSKEERDKISDMPASEYIPLRIKQAFNPKEHSAATVGFCTIANGALFTASGLYQFTGMQGRFSWKKVPLEAVQGVMTMAAGAALQFLPNQERAWQVSKAVFLYRAPVAGGQAWRAWKHGIPGKVDSGDWEQGAKFVLNQSSNVFGGLYGGIKKENGEIVRVSDDEQPPATPQTVNRYSSASANSLEPEMMVDAKHAQTERVSHAKSSEIS